MSVLFALVAAVTYGVSDFVGGLASRREQAVLVLLVSEPAGAVLMAVLLPVYPGRLDAAVLGWSAAAGVAGMAGVVLLYRGLGAGPMAVVAPLTAIASAVVPLGVGVLLLDERPPPLSYLGVLLALLAVALVSRGPDGGDTPGHRRIGPRAVALALLAGVGFGLFFVLLDRAPDGSGAWPLVVSRVAASLGVLGVAVTAAGRLRPPAGRALPMALVAGALDALANLAYLLAVRSGLLALVAVLVALYPAGTVLLARLVLGERTGRVQRLGLAVAGVGVALIAWAG